MEFEPKTLCDLVDHSVITEGCGFKSHLGLGFFSEFDFSMNLNLNKSVTLEIIFSYWE